MSTVFEQLQKVFFDHDPADLDVSSNNLPDEYDSEIETLLECMKEYEIVDICDLAECLDQIFAEYFNPVEIELKEDFVTSVAKVLNLDIN